MLCFFIGKRTFCSQADPPEYKLSLLVYCKTLLFLLKVEISRNYFSSAQKWDGFWPRFQISRGQWDSVCAVISFKYKYIIKISYGLSQNRVSQMMQVMWRTETITFNYCIQVFIHFLNCEYKSRIFKQKSSL